MNDSVCKKKKQALRNNEYYDMQKVFDELYANSKRNVKFKNLMQYITCENNILLAFRNIKRNSGSHTVGTDGRDIKYYENMPKEEFVNLIQRKLENYKPKSVRRVEIPKNDGRTRPLGIPCMIDRLIQQCIKQVVEPICEAKFHGYSFGFRPNRSTNHAIARAFQLVNRAKMYYVVDIDIKGFFDNVNHAKLKKQLWTMGIQDKNLICIIGKILKSEIEGIGVPDKGTPQGGIISPLLANIVLNELDWWLDSQFDGLKTEHKLEGSYRKYSLRNTNIKEIKFVRYADDFKIFCRNAKDAERIYHATKQWLQERLKLEINPQKSKITNLKKRYSEFLGFKFKARVKGKKYVCHSWMRDETKDKVIDALKRQIRKIQQDNNTKSVHGLNAMILGCHNYYKYASHISQDFQHISYIVHKSLMIRLREHISFKARYNKTYERLYGEYKNGKVISVKGITLFPIHGCKNTPPMQFNQRICDYTDIGRKLIHNKLGGYDDLIGYLLSTPNNNSTEYNDNRISLIAGQNGKCGVTGKKLNKYRMNCHHKIPRSQGGTDQYDNLIWLDTDVHILVHSTEENTIKRYLEILQLNAEALRKLNKLRIIIGNSKI